MLVLTRKPGEGLLIGDNISIKIIEVKSGAIRIGIDAPQEMKIYREEIYNRIKEENIGATNWDINDLDALTEDMLAKQVKK